MSKSRLEKFLYALYSLDSNDLPTPLSRIEELYKCLVTGEEVPTFEPLSRVEKYLMAILGGYDVDSLPNPLSRVEVLLYKLAIGDDNLDDFKSFLSEHEELLAEIIRNGGVGGNIDIEYVLYTLSTEFNTLYNTAEKPVKSAILKGNSEVVVGKNKCNVEKIELGWIDGTSGVVTSDEGVFVPVEVSGTITISNFINSRSRYVYEYDVDGNYLGRNSVDTDIVTLVLNENTTLIKLGFYRGSLSTVKSLKLQVEQGEIATEYEAYNQTLVSVKMPVLTTTGTNLYNPENQIIGSINDTTKTIIKHSKESLLFFKCEPNTTYTFKTIFGKSYPRNTVYTCDGIPEQGKSVTVLNASTSNNTLTVTTDEHTNYLVWRNFNLDNGVYTMDDLKKSAQIVIGESIGEYEPFKSNILTANVEVELRGIGEVKDELNLLTGEVEQSIYHLQLTGDERWGQSGYTNDDYLVAYTTFTNNLTIPSSKVICDKINYDSSVGITTAQKEGINIIGDCSLRISLSKTKVATLNDFINWVRKEQPLVNFVAKEKSIKTVDLSVVNQDGNSTELSTFNDITHVTLSSEGLIPEAELEVATKNEEVLNTMSLEMDDISKTQNDLQETLDTQSENVDSTMIATTEIYEGLL